MFQNISEILKSFSGKQRFTVLVMLLVTITISIFIKSYFTSTDLAPMQKQLNECVASQGNLVNQNSVLVGKTKELTDGYLQIDSLLRHMKPDTVYIVKVEKITEPQNTQIAALAKHNPDEIILESFPPIKSSQSISNTTVSKKDTTITKSLKKGNVKEICNNLQQIVNKSKK
jgi:hypothetical protein